MKERPIIFAGPSVRAIFADRKTQTRRVVNPQPEPWSDNPAFLVWKRRGYEHGPLVLRHIEAAFGEPGNRLWVRETWAENEPPSGWLYRADDPTDYYATTGAVRWRSPRFMPRDAARLFLEVTEVRVQRLQEISEEDAGAEGMESNAGREGLRYLGGGCWISAKHSGWERAMGPCLRAEFACAWDALQLSRHYTRVRPGQSWLSNPWVWAITFRRLA